MAQVSFLDRLGRAADAVERLALAVEANAGDPAAQGRRVAELLAQARRLRLEVSLAAALAMPAPAGLNEVLS